MTETRFAKGVLVVILAGALLGHPALHTETIHYVPTTTIVHNGGQVITATASASDPQQMSGADRHAGALTHNQVRA